MRAYVHIPFCRQKCGYCKFALTPFVRETEIARYFSALRDEIETFFTHEKGIPPIETLYFGGGTPSAVGAPRIASIIETFRSHVGIAPDAEITVEANPEDLSLEFCRGILDSGCNRLSIGVQSLDDSVLKTVGRSNTQTIFNGVRNAFDAGFRNVGCDFIVGLPGEYAGAVPKAISQMVSIFPITHISVYLLEEGKYPEKWKGTLPSVETMRKDFLLARSLLLEHGFTHYEISNFAKTGFDSRHNRGYWNRLDTRWFGLSAASLWKWERFENAASFSGYYRGETVLREHLTSEQIAFEEALCGIRTFALDTKFVCNRSKLYEYIEQGWLTEGNKTVSLTSAWIFFTDHIISGLI